MRQAALSQEPQGAADELVQNAGVAYRAKAMTRAWHKSPCNAQCETTVVLKLRSHS